MEEEKFEISYEALWKAVIRPPRDNYSEEELAKTKESIKKFVKPTVDFFFCGRLVQFYCNYIL